MAEVDGTGDLCAHSGGVLEERSLTSANSVARGLALNTSWTHITGSTQVQPTFIPMSHLPPVFKSSLEVSSDHEDLVQFN